MTEIRKSLSIEHFEHLIRGGTLISRHEDDMLIICLVDIGYVEMS